MGESGSWGTIINYYQYIPNDNLKIKKFSDLSDEWLDFIAACRSGKTHTYDIVEGPMANDTVWNYVNDFSDRTDYQKTVLGFGRVQISNPSD
mgnify:FL=1